MREAPTPTTTRNRPVNTLFPGTVAEAATVTQLRDALLRVGHLDLADGVSRHRITSLEHAQSIVNDAYGWEALSGPADDLAAIRNAVRILDGYTSDRPAELLHWL